MSSPLVEYFAPGIPVSKGSGSRVVRPDGRSVYINQHPRELKVWEEAHAWHARACAQSSEPIRGHGMHVALRYVFERPKSHMRMDGGLRKGKPLEHIYRPDLDKLCRGVLDPLTGIVWGDDSQVVSLWAIKHWGPQAGCWVTVGRASEEGT